MNRYRSLVEAEYRKALNSLVRITPVSACNALLLQAKQDRAIKELIIHSLLPSVFQYAMRICPREPMDLIAIGNATLLEEWERAQDQEWPLRYLLNRSKMAMYSYLRQYGCGPITFPDRGDREHSEYMFFEMLSKSAESVFDLLDPGMVTIVSPVIDLQPLYEAIEALRSENARILIERLFGLFGRPEESMLDIAGDSWKSNRYGAIRETKKATMQRLKAYLIERYPDFVEQHACAILEEKVRAKAYSRLYEIGKISPSQRRRLDEARLRLEAHGEPLTGKALRQEAGVGSSACCAYLYELRIKP